MPRLTMRVLMALPAGLLLFLFFALLDQLADLLSALVADFRVELGTMGLGSLLAANMAPFSPIFS